MCAHCQTCSAQLSSRPTVVNVNEDFRHNLTLAHISVGNASVRFLALCCVSFQVCDEPVRLDSRSVSL